MRETSFDRARPELCRFLRGQVADDSDEARAVGVARLAHRERDRKRLAVRALADDLSTDADDVRLAAREVARDVAAMLRVIGLRHQRVDGLADDLIRAVAEQTLGGGVERHDRPARVDHDDPVDRGIEQRL